VPGCATRLRATTGVWSRPPAGSGPRRRRALKRCETFPVARGDMLVSKTPLHPLPSDRGTALAVARPWPSSTPRAPRPRQQLVLIGVHQPMQGSLDPGVLALELCLACDHRWRCVQFPDAAIELRANQRRVGDQRGHLLPDQLIELLLPDGSGHTAAVGKATMIGAETAIVRLRLPIRTAARRTLHVVE